MNKTGFYYRILIVIVLLLTSFASLARCSRTSALRTADNYMARIPFGKINLYDTYFYPVGSQLGSIVVPPTNYTSTGASASTVLWTCDAADAGSIYFLVATNGDDRVGGFYDIGTTDGLTDVYATFFAYVGLKQTMSNIALTRYWQKVEIPSYDTETTPGKINIRLQDIPPLQSELYRISSLPAKGARSDYCSSKGSSGTPDRGLVFGSTTGSNYVCNQPNSYIQLVGPNITHDEVGEDSAVRYRFHGANNGFGYGMYLVNTLYDTPTCVARSATPLVLLPTISIAQLMAGEPSSAPFNVSIECSDSAMTESSNPQTALGFQVSAGAYSAAQSLGLVNSSNGVSMLLSDNYTDSEMAKGVGITIAYNSNPGSALTLIGQSGLNALTDTGANSGWYPVKDYATSAGSSKSGYTNYDYSFLATLKRIPGQTITAGKVRATVTVQVRIQ